jgi:hypothetical protein
LRRFAKVPLRVTEGRKSSNDSSTVAEYGKVSSERSRVFWYDALPSSLQGPRV